MSISITDSVGRDGKNRVADTRRIQRALNQVTGGARLAVDGDCGPKTIKRIETFQRRFMSRPDGRIDPGGRSLRELNQMLEVKPIKQAAVKKTVKTAASKKAATRKAATRKAATKKAATKKAATKKAATKKAATKKAATKKAATKKAATKKAATKKAATKKAATKKSAAKKAATAATALTRASLKSTAKKTARKAVKKKTASKGITVSASVGRGGDNREADVRLVQQALNELIPEQPLKVDGKCGDKTVAKIEQFQRGFMSRPDGRIDPGGRTIRRLGRSAPTLQGAWKGDSSKWSEAKKLDSLDSALRKKVERVLANLKAEGFVPKIVYAWRSVEVQRQLVAQGHSKVRFSYHNAQYKNGRPRAYAADIIDRRWAWSDAAMGNGFWAALGRIAKAEGLYWGGDWRSFKDWAHVQAYPNTKLTEIKRQSGVG